jgi:hypothetical protein
VTVPSIANAQSSQASLLAEGTLSSAPLPSPPIYQFETMTELAPASPTSSPDASSHEFASQESASQEPASQQPTPDAVPPVSDRIKIEPSDLKKHKGAPESEIGFGGMVSYGNWEFFAAGIHEWLYTGGLEYYRHSWGYFAGAQMDYAADFMPLVILKEPRTLNPYGVRRSKPGDDVLLHGIAFSPIGLRMQWRHDKTFKPYFSVLGGAIGFTKKALSPDASYFDFTLHETIGFYYKMTERVDMRVGLFGDFHFSNAYITSYNPGLDVMNSQIAFSYRFGRKDDPRP